MGSGYNSDDNDDSGNGCDDDDSKHDGDDGDDDGYDDNDGAHPQQGDLRFLAVIESGYKCRARTCDRKVYSNARANPPGKPEEY
ncbi:hypothetical protein PoB_000607900 [Plakobranchus ocellatus]|uniref:Uncharacterized protein n=1 Tax=Plakobranchus ocellatus TaxID=259542 RepID=A0AAV3Y9E0_9GAST|nr:hypothetical protein PoB_000607900 [Plakobranchus ocellatus]